MANSINQSTEPVRIDRWLWAARLFKTRNRAKEAVVGGKVHVNGKRVKPSRPLRVGELLSVTRDRESIDLVVKSLSDRRGSASVADQLYDETQESIERREKDSQQRSLLKEGFISSAKKPDKGQREEIRRFKSRLR